MLCCDTILDLFGCMHFFFKLENLEMLRGPGLSSVTTPGTDGVYCTKFFLPLLCLDLISTWFFQKEGFVHSQRSEANLNLTLTE